MNKQEGFEMRPRTNVLLFCLTLAIGTIPALSQKRLQIEFEKYELANGLDVILHENHSIPLVSVNLWYHVGSGNEKPGRTGFAHLFEHLMFQGSEHQTGDYFETLQKIGGSVNGSTTADRTNYWENIPSNYLELALWLESDRMGHLLPATTQEKLDNQRDVVKNERRQNYENRPYGKTVEIFPKVLYPQGHPYSWTTIGSMQDLSAASLEDVHKFFRQYYSPNNASLVIAGDIEIEQTRKLVEKYFGPIKPGPPVDRLESWPVKLTSPVRATLEDNVHLARIYLTWHTPAFFAPGDAEFDLLANILASGKTSRLYHSLVYKQQIAQDVTTYQSSRKLGSEFRIIATVRPKQSIEALEIALKTELEKVLKNGITEEELQRAQNEWESSFTRRLERIGGFGGVSDQLNLYNFHLGNPGGFQWDMERYSATTVDKVMAYARQYLKPESRTSVLVLPQGQLAMTSTKLDRSLLPAGKPEPIFEPPVVQKDLLPNGMNILVVEKRDLPLVQVRLIIKSGFGADPKEHPGTASLTAELIDEGTRNRDALQLDAAFQKLGVRLQTGSTFDSSFISFNILKRNLKKGMELLSEVVIHPIFPHDELQRQRRIYLGKIQQEAKNANTTAIKAFMRTLYSKGHPYAQSYTGTGTKTSIQSMTRIQLETFYHANYSPQNSALIFVGDISFNEARDHAQLALGSWTGRKTELVRIPDPKPIHQTEVYLIDKPGAVQSVIIAGNLAIKRNSQDYRRFQLMNNIFGGKFSSRLNLNLREDKGFTYGARSIFLARQGTGPFFVLVPVQTQSTSESILEIIKEYKNIIGPRPITRREILEAQGHLIKGFPQEFETVESISQQVANIYLYSLDNNEWTHSLRELERITENEATSTARTYLDPEALLIVVVGDVEKIEEKIRQLNLSNIRYLATQ